MNRICLYSICKNEEYNVKLWIERNVKGTYESIPDVVCVVDTGSTDNTFNILTKEYSDNLSIDVLDRFIQDEFDFAEARNYALNAAKKYILSNHTRYNENDTWIFICLDMDEFLVDSAETYKILKEEWNDSYDVGEMTCNIYHTGGDDDLGTMRVRHKIHRWDAEWFRSIHEYIRIKGKKESEWNIFLHYIGLTNKGLWYDHIQNNSKPRDYKKMLIQSYNKGDRSIKTLTYLAWECIDDGEYDDVIRYAEKAIDLLYNNEEDDQYMDILYILCNLIYLFDSYRNIGAISSAELRAANIMHIFGSGQYHPFRNALLKIADFYFDKNNTEKALFIYLSAYFTKSFDPSCYLDIESLYDHYKDIDIYHKIIECTMKLGYGYEAYILGVLKNE